MAPMMSWAWHYDQAGIPEVAFNFITANEL